MAARHSSSRRGVPQTLVDAHNLIHADPELRALMPEPEEARWALAERVRGLPRLRLVCDGGPGGHDQLRVHHGVTLAYCGRLSADDAIVAWLVAHPQERAVVVTDDGALARRARTLGARVMACRDFLLQLPRAQADAGDGRRAPPPPAEVAQWLRVFGLDRDGAAGSDSDADGDGEAAGGQRC